MQQISWNREGFDPFLDFLKGLCIICFVLTHCLNTKMQKACLFPLWGAFSVPIFLTISCFHYFKKPHSLERNYFSKIWKRIILPFLVVQLLLVGKIIISYCMGSDVLTAPLKSLLMHGEDAPGSYYFWVHLQFSLLVLPLTAFLIKRRRVSDKVFLCIFAVLSIAMELLSNWLQIPQYIHRLLCLPYIFVVYYGYRLANGAIDLSWKSYVWAFLSLVCVVLLNYTSIDFSPWVYMHTSKNFHMFCFPFMIYVVVVFAKKLFDFTKGTLRGYIQNIGKCSYEIFCWQMIVFVITPYSMNKWLYVATTTLLSIVPVIIFYAIKEKTKSR